MFDDLLGNFEKQQEALNETLSKIVISVSSEGISITGNATKEVTNVEISENLLAVENKEMIEDLIISAMNKFIAEAVSKELTASQESFKNILPEGFGDLLK